MKQNSDLKFKRIISLGFYCGVAQELEKMHLRDASYPFDWVISDLNSINKLIANNFRNLFSINSLYRDGDYPYIVKHKEYKFDFYHDFSPENSIESQIEKVQNRYCRRILRFFDELNSKKSILFIRYLYEESKNGEINIEVSNDIQEFVNIIEKFTKNFKIVLIKHKELLLNDSSKNEHIIRVFDVDKPKGKYANDDFIHSSKEIEEFFGGEVMYNIFAKLKNIVFYRKKQILNKIKSIKKNK